MRNGKIRIYAYYFLTSPKSNHFGNVNKPTQLDESVVGQLLIK